MSGMSYPQLLVRLKRELTNDYHADSDHKKSPITWLSNGPQLDEISKQLINVFGDTDDYLSAEVKYIINHKHSDNVLEF